MATKKRPVRAVPDNYTVEPPRKDLLIGRKLSPAEIANKSRPPIDPELLRRLRDDLNIMAMFGTDGEKQAARELQAVLAGAKHQSEVMVNARQMAMMRHATGGQHDAHRNYYCVEPDHEDRVLWEQLAEMGLAALGEPDGRENNKVFHVTELGYRFVYGKPHREPAWCHECETALTDAVQPGPGESCGAEFCGECLLNHECD